MLRGELVLLRARREDDVPVLHAELYDDVATRSRADSRSWRPLPVTVDSPYAPRERSESTAAFSVVELRSDELAGEALLWGIDLHNRCGHVGLSLRPSFRGRGLGLDTVRVLTTYGFATLGLHRLQIDTLAENESMIATAGRAGYAREGTLRGAAWVDGAFVDEVVLGRVAGDAP
jgi:RimJ/RimL family protein N-acetyltransferase